ncbi:MAG: DUF3352 domain-containing protein [Pyrinomonadaceae bacterium]
MNNFKKAKPLVASIVAIVILATPLLAQQRRNAPRRLAAPEPAPTFDSLLAADSFKFYCEIRGVGGLVRSSAVNDLLDPIMKLGGPPKEFKAVVKWLNTHADVLAGSRMMVAGWPSRPKLPNVLIAIEFSSPEEAKKFYPELRDFLPKLLPTPTPSPVPTPAPDAKPSSAGSPGSSETPVVRAELIGRAPQSLSTVAEKEPEPLPPYQMRQAGSLVFISDIAFTFRNLRPRGSKALEEDQNFLLARNRFASESLFLYVDLKAIEREEKEQRQKSEEEAQKQAEAEATKVEEPVTVAGDPALTAVPVEEQPMPPPEPSPYEQPTEIEPTADPPASSNATLSNGPQPDIDEGPNFYSFYSMIFGGGETKWPEAVGAALVFENDAYVLRTLIINKDENKGSAIPFVPQFISGPAMAPESPNVFPADVDLFVSASLDYPQIYEGMLRAFAGVEEQQKKFAGPYERAGMSGPRETPFAYYEKKLGLKIKDDLLPLLGNELALALPRKAKKAANEPATNSPTDNPASGHAGQENAKVTFSPLIAIAVKDREAVGRLIPKILEGFGLKGASRLAQTEKHDGAEIVSFAGVFSYAFVDNFLVLSLDPAETRHVVDAYVNHQTLSSDSHFRNYTRWQPRQVLGQVYMAPGLVEEYVFGSGRSAAADKVSDFLSGVNPVIDPLTYSLSNDGLGPFHELHMPKNLLQLLMAQTLVGTSESLPTRNEAVASGIMRNVAGAEATFKSTEGNNGYGTVDQLVSAGLLSKEMLDKYGYRIEVSASSDKFQITAVPVEYGTTGKLSFFIDESQILRGGDHGGGAATADDQPL